MKTKKSHTDYQCTYLLPIRRVRFDKSEAEKLADYFQLLASVGCEVLVVDGSPSSVFQQQNSVWSSVCRHVPPDRQYKYLNGKVNSVHTGVDLASAERIILADDDIRYTTDDVVRICELLDNFEMVRPQNFISPLPWWARIENARILINRGTLRAGDYPGTCGFRRSTMKQVGPYDGDVLFDNEEIVRHFAIKGINIKYAVDFFILKQPPKLSKWFEQRPRQAYEDFVMRAKTATFFSVIPALAVLTFLFGFGGLFAGESLVATCAAALSVRGLLRNHAYRFFPMNSFVWAPLWVMERSFSVYWALYWRVRYGGYPFGQQLLSKGTGAAWIAGGKIQSRILARH